MIKKFTFIAIIAGALVSTVSCQKSTELMVIGRWLIDHVGDPADQPGAYWEFDSNGGVTFYLSPQSEKPSIYKGDWKIKKSLLRRFIEIKGVEPFGEAGIYEDLNGSWRIDFLDNQKMGVVRVDCPTCPSEGQSYIRRDFTKMK